MNLRAKNLFTLFLAFCIVITSLPSAFTESICNHIHDAECNYIEGDAEYPCNHVHDDMCIPYDILIEDDPNDPEEPLTPQPSEPPLAPQSSETPDTPEASEIPDIPEASETPISSQLQTPFAGDLGVLSSVYWDPIGGVDENDGSTALSPVKSIDVALSLAASNATIILLNVAYLINTDTTIDGGENRNITIQRYPGIDGVGSFDGDIFLVGTGNTLTLKNITLDGGVQSAKNLINVSSSATLAIAENVYITNGGLISLDGTANPISLLEEPPPDMAAPYTIITNNLTPGRIIVTTDCINAGDYFKLAAIHSAEYELQVSGTSLVIATIADYGDGIYLSGSGDDNNDGSTSAKAVKTYARAKELLDSKVTADPKYIYICGTVILDTSTPKIENVNIKRASGFTNNRLFNITGGISAASGGFTFTLSNTVIDNGGSNQMVFYCSAADYLKMENDSRITNCAGNAIQIYNSGKLTIKDATIETTGISAILTSARYNSTVEIDGERANIEKAILMPVNNSNYIPLNSIIITSQTVTKNYVINLNTGPQYVTGIPIVKSIDGSDMAPYLDKFTLNSTPINYILIPYKNDLVLTTPNAVYIDSVNGNDGNDGLSPMKPVLNIEKVVDIANNNAEISEIYVLEQPITIDTAQSINAPDISIYKFTNFDGNGMFNVINGGILNLEEITLNGKVGATGGLIYVNGGSLVMNNGASITNNTNTISTTNVSIYGAGVYMVNGTIEMNDGASITGNTVSNTTTNGSSTGCAGGAGVYMEDGLFTMNDGIITGNTSSTISSSARATSGGAGVYLKNGIFTMTGGEISGNISTETGTPLGDQVVVENGMFDMQSGTITGVLNTIQISESARIKLYPQSLITGMIYCMNSTEGSIILGSPLPDGKIFIINTVETMVGKKLVDGSHNSADVINFKLYDGISSMYLYQSGDDVFVGALVVYLNGISGNDANTGASPDYAVKTFARAKEILYGMPSGWIVITGTVTITGTEEWDLSGGPEGAMIQRGNGVTVNLISITTGTLTLKDIIIDGNSTQSDSSLISISNANGRLNIEVGTILQNNDSGSADTGSAINCTMDAVITMTGGIIRDCVNSIYGAVYINRADAIFNMSGGIIENTSSATSLGVYIRGGTLNMSGGTVQNITPPSASATIFIYNNVNAYANISENALIQNNNGVGIRSNGGVLNFDGGSILNNTSHGILGGTAKGVHITSGLIDGNGGSGVYTNNLTNISGGTISNNKGGGVSVAGSNGLLNIYNGLITNNSNTNGGGINGNNGNSTINIFGGTISNNTAELNGGGLFMTYGTINIFGGTISNNTASSNGGGLYATYNPSNARASTLNITGGLITGNTAGNNGGGINLTSGTSIIGTCNIDGGTISDNIAMNGGGVSISNYSYNMNNGNISGNTADNNGGGMYIFAANSTFNSNGGTIISNTAEKGGGVYLQAGTFNAESGTITGNTTTSASNISGEVHFYGGTFNILKGNCNIGGNIFLRTNQVMTIDSAITNSAQTYKVWSEKTALGTVIVKPNGITVGDAKQFIRNFVLANAATDGKSGLVGSDNNIIIGAFLSYFIDGTRASKGNGSNPENAFNEIADLDAFLGGTENIIIYVCGAITVSDIQDIIATNPNVSIRRYSGFPVDGISGYDAYFGDMFVVEEDGTLNIKDLSISGANTEFDDGEVTGSIINNNGTVNLSGNSSIVNNTSTESGAGIYQNGTLNVTNSPIINCGVYLTEDNCINAEGLGTDAMITNIEIENPSGGYVVVKYPTTPSNAELLKYELDPSQSGKYEMIIDGNNIVLFAKSFYFDIIKEIGEADGIQQFVFKVEYKPSAISEKVENVFYTVLTIESGQTEALQSMAVSGSGRYVITEMDSNWQYTKASPKTITIVENSNDSDLLLYDKSATFMNTKKDSNLKSSKDSITNIMSTI